jgi:hypothetical protein
MSVGLNPGDAVVEVANLSDEAEALAHMRGMIIGFFITQSISAAAELRIADRLANGPRTPSELAVECGVQERPLYRMLRALAGEGIFAEKADGRFHLTPLAEVLRSDHSKSLRDWALYVADLTYRGATGLLETLRTGEPSFTTQFGLPLFDFLDQHPESAVKLYRAMSSVSAARTAALLQAYDFSGTRWLLDVGGAHGAATAAIAQKYPSIRCTCVDRPGAEQGALTLFAERAFQRDATSSRLTSSKTIYPLVQTRTCSVQSCTTGTISVVLHFCGTADGECQVQTAYW